MSQKVVVFWFRRDLRLRDNAGLARAMQSGYPVIPIFIFDPAILGTFEQTYDRRMDYIHQALGVMDAELRQEGSAMWVYHDRPLSVFNRLARDFEIQGIYCNRDYEPIAKFRDTSIAAFAQSRQIAFECSKDQVIFEGADLLKADGKPYTVFTPYARTWRARFTKADRSSHQFADPNWYLGGEVPQLPSLTNLGFAKTDLIFQPPVIEESIIRPYGEHRDYPAQDMTTRLGMALRFGTISIRSCVSVAIEHSEVWLKELIWREFFMQILDHYPLVVHRAFRPKYDRIVWRNDESEFQAWCEGKTGYPLVDAGMRQLHQTGFIHNRVRMVVASFLCKHLLIDWRWGEAYFAQNLNDYELASNNGNWQWVVGSGCDAAPYFRIFNPDLQQKRFDPKLEYVKKWLPEWDSPDYPKPIVEHAFARNRAIHAYKNYL